MQNTQIIGVDMGGTKIHTARIAKNMLVDEYKVATPANKNESYVINTLISAIEEVYDNNCRGIGIGVPSVVDTRKGIVYDVMAIPSWKKVHLKDILENHFNKPVWINNDANCFVLGEKYFGNGKKYGNLVGLTLGTGLGAGIVINHKLYNGANCGAGEFGCMPYKNSILEDYCASRFFQQQYKTSGSEVFELAEKGNSDALQIFNDLGYHIGFAIKMILLTLDPEAIFLGGSVSEAYPFFKQTMWESLKDYPFPSSIAKLTIEKSDLKQAAIYGAAALVMEN